MLCDMIIFHVLSIAVDSSSSAMWRPCYGGCLDGLCNTSIVLMSQLYCRSTLTKMSGQREAFCTQQAVASSRQTAPSMSMQRISGMSSQSQYPAARSVWTELRHNLHCNKVQILHARSVVC